ncbi:MAG TPA: Maf family nucleotide pyrophosphatase [Usitatibacter sp.]
MTDISLVLASGSPYRRELLARLAVAFETWSPEIDERALAQESPRDTAVRLAHVKAAAALARWPGAIVIGSDQVAEVDGAPIGKPGTLDNARRQLRQLSGRAVAFHTALCVLNGASGKRHDRLVTTDVEFRALSDTDIERYLAREPALDCAGSAKSEGLGIALLSRLSGDDPTALVGLPLIALAGILRAEGIEIP